MSHASALAPKACPTCGNRYAADALFCPNDGTPLTKPAPGISGEPGASPSDPYLGREISGHIEIQQLVGIGAMGRVYRAFQKGIDRDVAVKILHRELSANQQLVSRFNREAKVASKLQHPNVVQVHLAGQLPDGALYIVMEYLDGLSLLSALSAVNGAMPLPRALHLGLQICDAAGEAHAHGVVHRDIKPENVMLVKRGDDADFVKVLDFGIARLNWGDQSMATAAGLIFGTARYISPEGAQGEQVGPQGDVYAIATLFYQMLSGRTPFEGEQAVGLLIQQIHDAPPELRSIPRATYVPEPIASVVMRNLAKRPQDRDPDARTFGRAIIDAARASGLTPEDFGARGLMQGRGSNPMQLAPMQRTRQLQLDQELADRLGGGARPSPGAGTTPTTPPRTAVETPAPAAFGAREGRGTGTEISADPSRAAPPPAPGALTTKWTPPAGFQAQLAAGLAEGRPTARSPSPPPAARATRPTPAVDATLDDGDLVSPPPYFPPTPQPAAYGPPEGSGPRAAHRGQRDPSDAQIAVAGARVSSPRMTTEAPLEEEEQAGAPARSSRTIMLVILCFLVGVAGATGVAYKLGRIGTAAAAAALEDHVARATDAFRNHRFDSPPGDNVKDITDEALRRWPNEPRLLEVRTHAADDLVTIAIEKRHASDTPEAVRLLKLALELHPEERSARTLMDQYEAELNAGMKLQPLAPPSGAAQGIAPGVAPLAPPPRPGPSAGVVTLRTTLDAAPDRPRPGQPVQLTARVTTGAGGAPKATFEQPRFEISGPGISGSTKMPAMSEVPGVFRAAFTFFEPGRYEVVFLAKADGTRLGVARVVIAGEGAAPALPPGPPPVPAVTPSPGTSGPVHPLPASSGKWL